jgi:catechol 2,3-dioxygenase-like lactoylglutathione lyase family enzyme
VSDLGLTHVALPVADIDRSVAFYARYAAMQVVHERADSASGKRVVWLSDRTRPFAVVLIEADHAGAVLRPFAHLGVGCASRAEVDRLCRMAHAEGVLLEGPHDHGPPVGYWALLRDPDGNALELSPGQEVGLAAG